MDSSVAQNRHCVCAESTGRPAVDYAHTLLGQRMRVSCSQDSAHLRPLVASVKQSVRSQSAGCR